MSSSDGNNDDDDNEEVVLLSQVDDDDDDNEGRRDAELEVISACYGPDEVWFVKDRSDDDEMVSTAMKPTTRGITQSKKNQQSSANIISVYRRLVASNVTSNSDDQEQQQNDDLLVEEIRQEHDNESSSPSAVNLLLRLDMPHKYPANACLDVVSCTIDEERTRRTATSQSNKHLLKIAYNSLCCLLRTLS